MRMQCTGAFLPMLDPAATKIALETCVRACEADIRRRIAAGDPSWTPAQLTDWLPDLRAELDTELPAAAIFELAVLDNDEAFSPHRIHIQKPDFGDEVVVLLPSGVEVTLTDYCVPPEFNEFTVVLLVYRWEPAPYLAGDYGRIALPRPAPVPERVWTVLMGALGRH